jgi:predicted nicotinamide N-methyase
LDCSDNLLSHIAVETSTFRVGTHDYHVRSLRDRQQFWDGDQRSAEAGISSASWPLFGVLWPSGRALAEEMCEFPIGGKRILEAGCGIGLCSMVLQQRGADITASDYHPVAEEFLRHNTDLNGLFPIHFQQAPWAGPNPELGRFDLIVGSDLLYERGHPALLAGFLACHTNPSAQVILTDPGRTYCGQFSTKMAEQGYTRTERRRHFTGSDLRTSRGRIMSFIRGEV